MEINKSAKRNIFSELYAGFRFLLRTWQFWVGVGVILFGEQLNYASQTYLHNYMEEGKTLPMLSDLILDHIPSIDVAILYDIFALLVFVCIFVYVVHRNEYKKVPYFLLLCGIFYIVRGVFIVLTPFGNPPNFNPTSPFNGFSKFDLGVYPSGHVGSSFLLLLLIGDKFYKWITGICLLVVIITLFLAHGHYSIDIFSGFFFSYAVYSFGEKYLTGFDLSGRSSQIINK